MGAVFRRQGKSLCDCCICCADCVLIKCPAYVRHPCSQGTATHSATSLTRCPTLPPLQVFLAKCIRQNSDDSEVADILELLKDRDAAGDAEAVCALVDVYLPQ